MERSLWRRREREPEGGSPSLLTLAMDFAAVRLDDVPGDGEAEAGAAQVLGSRHLVEKLEDGLAMGRRHATASVGHGEAGAAFPSFGPHRHCATGRRVG